MSVLAAVAGDLAAEGTVLDEALAVVDWAAATPAEGWTVRDTVAHLHLSDLAGLASLRGEDLQPWLVPVVTARYDGENLPADWVAARAGLTRAVLARPADAGKIPWFGPPMSPASFLTARLMETWAHGVDVRDAAGRPTPATTRLRHVADLGVRTRGWSYAVRGLPVPTAAVRVELSAPGGPWTWGPADAPQTVRGPALDFCLRVVQRRPLSSLALTAEGADAEQWLQVAQAFAGRPTDGRR